MLSTRNGSTLQAPLFSQFSAQFPRVLPASFGSRTTEITNRNEKSRKTDTISTESNFVEIFQNLWNEISEEKMLRSSLHQPRIMDDKEVESIGDLSWSSDWSDGSTCNDDSSCSITASGTNDSDEESIVQESDDSDSDDLEDEEAIVMFSPRQNARPRRRQLPSRGGVRRTNSFSDLMSPEVLPQKMIEMRMADSMHDLCSIKAMVLDSEDEKGESDDEESVQETSPQDHLRTILQGEGIDDAPTPAKDMVGFFVEMSQDNVKAYTLPKTIAIRKDDVREFRRMHSRGEQLDCCNRFGESILHTACRRGSITCLRYLVEEVGLTLRRVDDQGRTIFHDAAWTSRPNFELVDILIQHCPKLLLVADGRGFTPLMYVPKEQWTLWHNYLDSHAETLVRAFQS